MFCFNLKLRTILIAFLLLGSYFGYSQIVTKQLYFSDPSQTLDQVNPVAEGDTTISQSELIGYFPSATVNIVNSFSGYAGVTASSIFTLSNVEVLSGTNRLMLVGVSTKDGKVTSVTYNNVPLTLVGYLDGTIMSTQAPVETGSNSAEVYIYKYLNPPVGTADVVVTLDSDYKKGIVVGATNFSGVDQITPLGTFASAVYHDFSEAPFDLYVPSSNNALVFDVSSVRNDTQTMDGSQSQLYNIDTGSETHGGSSTKVAATTSTLMSWSSTSCQEVGRAGVAINPGSYTTTTFTQSDALCNTLTIKSNETITVSSYVSIESGTMPINPTITAQLKYGSNTIITLINPTYNSGSGLLTWTGTLGSDISIPSGNSIALKITTAEPDVSFYIDYDSQTKPSKIEFSMVSGSDIFPPDQPSKISGNVSPSLGSTQTYSITNVSGLTYNWVLPSGWVQTVGGATNSITVTVGSLSGSISVTPNNGSCDGEPRTLNLFTATKQLYLSDTSQILDRIDPEATGDTTTSSTSTISSGSTVTVDLIATKDTGIKLKNAAKNYGSCTSIILDRETTDLQRMLVQFDLSSIPAGAVIESAELRLNCTSGADMDVSVFKIGATDVWDEGTLCGSAGTSNWTQTNSTTNWSAIGAIGPNSDSGTPISTINVNSTGIQSWPITCLVEDWVSGASINNGMALSVYATSGQGNREATYDTRETTTGIKPTLRITYATDAVSFTQSPSFCSPFVIQGNTPITITNYVTVTNGSMPANPDITATLKTDCSNTIITITDPTYDATTNLLTWTGYLGSDLTIPSGEAIILVIASNESGVDFTINYDSQTKPSKIEFSTSTFIEMTNYDVYDAAYPGGSIITSAEAGTMVYLRAEVTDPFGAYDITDMSVDNQGTSVSATAVATTSCTKTYEYPMFTPSTTGTFSYPAIAKEGYEETVTDSLSLDLTITTGKIDFDGIDDHIDFGNINGLTSSFSLEAWVLQQNSTGTKTIMSKTNTSSGNQRGYLLDVDAGIPFLKFFDDSGNMILNISTSPYSLANNKWHHVAASFNGTTAKLYVDGIELASGDPSDSIGYGSESFLIGASYNSDTPTSPVNYFDGYIDEVRVWGVALTQQQIREMMNQEIDQNETFVKGTIIPIDIPGNLLWSNLEAYYPMDENVADDKSKNHNFGIKKNITTTQEQTAPLPYTSIDINSSNAVDWDSSNSWSNGSVWNIPNSFGIDGGTSIDWNIAETKDNVYVSRDLKLLALINSSEELSINADNSLEISGYLKLDGKIDLEGESQLVQSSGSILDVNSSGNLERDQQGTKDLFTYNYWSSPVGISNTVSNNNSYSVPDILEDGTNSASPATITFLTSGRNGSIGPPLNIADYWIWKYANQPSNDYSGWQHVRSTGSVLAGEGFTMKGITDTNGNITLEQNYVMHGKPNNGDITLYLAANNDYLIGNPYPSSLDADEFIKDNISDMETNGRNSSGNVINGALYFWDHFASGSHILREYQGGYATYTLMGGIAAISTDSRINATGQLGTKIPERYIPVGQGFFVSAQLDSSLAGLSQPVVGGNINFKNSQRVFKTENITGLNTGSVFFKNNSSSKKEESSSEKEKQADNRQKIRLIYDSPNGYHRELLVGLDSIASNDFDLGYDAPLIESNSEDMYWLFSNNKFTIQAVNSFNQDQKLPLGIKTKTEGLSRVKIEALNNINDSLQIFIHDIDTNNYHDLRGSAYQIYLPAGNYTDRFEITFDRPKLQEEALSTTKNEFADFSVYYNNESRDIVVVNPNLLKLKNIELLNILGQSIISIEKIESVDVWSYNLGNLNSGTYIVKIKTENESVSKKVLVK